MQRRPIHLLASLRALFRRAVSLSTLALVCVAPLSANAELGAQTVAQPEALAPVSAPSGDAGSSPPIEINDDLPPIPTIDLTSRPDDLWQRVRNDFSMPNLDSSLVADRQAWYLNRPKMLQDILGRGRRYLYYIVQELEKRGMPSELALLPMVESAFNPLAYSRAKALGIWQFIPSTGKSYRLEQNWWLDERRDIVASTGAALDYLQTIYEMQGDWHLALASYNWGENAVARAVKKNRAQGLPTDYQHINMPGETRYYVPKLQALKNIIANPEAFGIKLDPIPNKPYFGTVDKPATMDVSTAASLAEIPVGEFIALNPAYSRPVIPASSDSPLILPADKVAVFLANLERHESEEKPLCVWHTRMLKKGERLDGVAAEHGLTLAHLKQINGIGPRTKVRPGFNLLVPDKNAPGVPALLLARLPMTPEATSPVRGKKGKKSGAHVSKKRGASIKAAAASKRKAVKRRKHYRYK